MIGKNMLSGLKVGTRVGPKVGLNVGDRESAVVGDGANVGVAEGTKLGTPVGLTQCVGATDGEPVPLLGTVVGLSVNSVGAPVGAGDGTPVGKDVLGA